MKSTCDTVLEVLPSISLRELISVKANAAGRDVSFVIYHSFSFNLPYALLGYSNAIQHGILTVSDYDSVMLYAVVASLLRL